MVWNVLIQLFVLSYHPAKNVYNIESAKWVINVSDPHSYFFTVVDFQRPHERLSQLLKLVSLVQTYGKRNSFYATSTDFGELLHIREGLIFFSLNERQHLFKQRS